MASGAQHDRFVRRGLKLIRSYTKHFQKHNVRCSSLCDTNYVKLIGTYSTFSSRHNIYFSACTIPIVLNRVGGLFQSKNAIGIDQSLGRLGLQVGTTQRRRQGLYNARPALSRLTRRLKRDIRGVALTIRTTRPVIDLAPRGQSRPSHRVSVPMRSPRRTLTSQVNLRRILKALPRRSRHLVQLHFCTGHARDRATGVLRAARIRVSQQRHGLLGLVQTGLLRRWRG